MVQTSAEGSATNRLSPDEERVLLVLARAERSITLTEISGRLETSPEGLRDAMRSLYRRRFLVISRGIGKIEDTYLLSQHARDYARSHLLPESPRRLPIEAVTPTDRRR